MVVSQVHNHGPEEGAGLDCREYRTEDGLRGKCMGVPSIAVDFQIMALCSICEDGIGNIDVVDADTIQCDDCGTSWNMNGEDGEWDD